MCRKRISKWVRDNRKTKTIVNEERWSLIKETFPERVKCRLEGSVDTTYDEYHAPTRVIADEGEVRKEYESEVQKIEKEKLDILQQDLEFVRQLAEEELKTLKEQEEKDEAAAYVLQQEEMHNLGVTLKSPTEHQRKLLALLKPKSPMKLRAKCVPPPTKNREETKQQKRRSSIRKYFSILPRPESENINQEQSVPCSSKQSDSDFQYATTLQSEFYSEIDEQLSPRKRLLLVSNSPIT